MYLQAWDDLVVTGNSGALSARWDAAPFIELLWMQTRLILIHALDSLFVGPFLIYRNHRSSAVKFIALFMVSGSRYWLCCLWTWPVSATEILPDAHGYCLGLICVRIRFIHSNGAASRLPVFRFWCWGVLQFVHKAERPVPMRISASVYARCQWTADLTAPYLSQASPDGACIIIEQWAAGSRILVGEVKPQTWGSRWMWNCHRATNVDLWNPHLMSEFWEP